MRLFSHPSEVCMSYWTHFTFSLYLAREFFIASLCAMAHAVHPDSFVTHSSDTLFRLQREMKKIGCRD